MSFYSKRSITRNLFHAMTIFDYLDTLRAKPVHIRKRIAVVTTALLSFLVFSVWVTSGNIGTATELPTRVVATPSPWAVAWNALGSAKDESLATLRNASGDLQNLVKSNLASVQSASTTQEESNFVPASIDEQSVQ